MAIDWKTILAADVDRLDPSDPSTEANLEALYPTLIAASIHPNDVLATPLNLAKLFRLSQSVMDEAEILRLKNLGMGGDASEIRTLRSDLADLQNRNMLLAKDAKLAQETLDMERKNVADLTMAIRDEKARSAALNTTAERLQVELNLANSQLAAHQARATARRADDDDFRSQLKEKNAEINRYLTEIQLLTTDNAQLRDDTETLGNELEVAVAELERAAHERQDSRDLIIKSDAQIDALTGERDALRIRLDELQDQLHRYKNMDDSRYEEATDQVAHIRKSMRDSLMDLADKDKVIRKMQLEIASLRAGVDESASDSLRRTLAERDETIRQLKMSLDQSQRDFALLATDWDQLESHGTAPEPQAVMAHQSEIERLKEKAEAYHRKHKEDLERLRMLEAQQVERERQVVDLGSRIEMYENGTYGLREAAREIKELQLQKSMRDKEVLELTNRINDYDAQVSDFLEENSELRRRLGIDEKTDIDVSNLSAKNHLVELEQVKALNQTLHNEIDRLEEERVLLKSQLRMRALEQGQRAVEMGLTAEELVDLEDYADQLRAKADSPDGKKTRSVVAQEGPSDHAPKSLEKLVLELERLHVDSAEARGRIVELEVELKAKSHEVDTLTAAVMSVMMTSRRRKVKANLQEASQDDHLTAVQQLMALLSRRLATSHDEASMSSIAPDLLDTSRALESDLASAETRIHELERELERTKQDAHQWQAHFQVHASERKHKVLSCPKDLRLASQDVLIETVVELGTELSANHNALLQLNRDLSHWKDEYGTMAGQLKKLYREYHELRQQCNDDVAKAKKNADIVAVSLEGAVSRAQEWENTAVLLGKASESSLKQELVEYQRKVTLLKVNETALIREYKILEDVESLQRKEVGRLRDDFASLESAAIEKLGLMQASLKAASRRVESLEEEVSSTVPASEHAKVVSKLESEIARNRLLLERDRNWEENIQQGVDVEYLRHELDKARAQATGLEAQIQSANASISSVSVERGAESTSRLHQQLGQLTANAAVLQSRCDTAESRADRFEMEAQQLLRRAEDSEKRYLEATQELMTWRGDVIRAAKPDEALVKELKQLKSERDKLTTDIHHYKLMAEVSSKQSSDLNTRIVRDKKEFEMLKATIRELQMQSEDKMVIGKLHNHIMALQASEAEALKKVEVSERKRLQLDATVTELERALDERDDNLFKARHDCRSLINDLRKTTQTMRLRLAGAVTLERYQRVCDQLHNAYVQTKSMKDDMTELLETTRALESKLDEKNLREELDRELVELMKNPTAAKDRLVEWQRKIAETRITHAAVTRENAALRQDLGRAESMCGSEREESHKLADKLLGLQAEFDERQLEWEQRQTDLELSLARLQEERELIFRAASSNELKDTLPDRSLPLANQLEAAIRMLLERAKQCKALSLQLRHAQDRVKEVQSQSVHQQNQLISKEVEITSLKFQKNDGHSQDGTSDDTARSIAREADAVTAAASKELIESLQRQLEHKEQMLQKYSGRLRESQDAIVAQKQADEREIAHLTKVINALNDTTIDRLKRPARAAEQSSDTNPDAGIIAELERLVAAKDCEIQHFANCVEELKAESEGWKARLSQLDTFLEAEQGKWAKTLEDMLCERRNLLQQVAEAKAEAAEAPSHILERQVKRLNTDLKTRDLKIKNLERAIEEMKNAAVVKAREPISDTTEARLTSASTRIVRLESRLEKLKKVVGSHSEERTKWEQDRRNLTDDISKLTNQLHTAESVSLQISLEKDKLAHRLRVLTMNASLLGSSSGHESLESPLDKGSSPIIRSTLLAGSPTTPMTCFEISSTPNPDLPHILKLRVPKHRPESAPAHIMFPMQSSPKPQASVAAECADKGSARQKWEAVHKLRSKLEVLKEKLEVKTKEAENATKLLASVRSTLEKQERERVKLQKQVQSLLSVPRLDLTAEHEKQVKHTLEIEDLRKKVAGLQAEIDHWKKVAQVDARNEAAQLKQERDQIKEKLDALQVVHEHLQRDLGDMEESMLERRISTLLQQNHKMQEHASQKDAELAQAVVERNLAQSALERSDKRIHELEFSLERMKVAACGDPDADQTSYGIRLPDFFIALPLAAQPKATREAQLAQVIEHLSKSLEKAHKDIEMLRAKATSDKKYMDLVKECKQLRADRDDALQKLAAQTNVANVERVEAENARLRTALRKEISKLQKEGRRALELEEENKRLVLEGQGLRRVVGHIPAESNDIAQLRAQLAEKEVQLHALQETCRASLNEMGTGTCSDMERRKLLRELELSKTRVAKLTSQIAEQARVSYGGVVVSDTSELSRRVHILEQENRDLKNELQVFDPSFFEELEDLKYSHCQALLTCQKHEVTIRSLMRGMLNRLSVALVVAALMAGSTGSIIYSTDLTLKSFANASSTSQLGLCANDTCSPQQAVDNFAPGNGTDNTGWVSNPQTQCSAFESFEVDWSGKYGAVHLGLVRFLWGERQSANVILSYKQFDGLFRAVDVPMTHNATDNFNYYAIADHMKGPVALGVRLNFTDLVAQNGTCYVTLQEIQGFAEYARQHGLSTGAKAGLTLTVVAVAAAAVYGGFVAYCRYRQKHADQTHVSLTAVHSEQPAVAVENPFADPVGSTV
ncbi:hypothetical protein SeMB42_g03165 [Synchytrium endobioticum]|uniref:Centrosomal protein of 290kDa coiled-coil region domain-containing protein n=1 Tax=Synchytrium endobioticum TaxID=286115 RepID=A0A507D8Y7_9FUNG|nr:hypothetical protein SeMB42_g03165 [Synchytrium endobioticum]